MTKIILPFLLIAATAQAQTSIHCQSSLIGPQGPSTIQIEPISNGIYSLSYQENKAQPFKVVSENLACDFSSDKEMPYVAFCHDDKISVNIKQTIEGQMYDGVGIQKFNFVIITTRQELQKSEFKTRMENCSIQK